MVVVSLIAILLMVVVPSFSMLNQRNRIAGEINGFVGDLAFARLEAVKRGQPVSLCASADGLTCLGTTTWNTGWIVFNDPNASQTIDPTETILRKQTGWVGTDTFVASNGLSAFMYSRDGFAIGLSGTRRLRCIPRQ